MAAIRPEPNGHERPPLGRDGTGYLLLERLRRRVFLRGGGRAADSPAHAAWLGARLPRTWAPAGPAWSGRSGGPAGSATTATAWGGASQTGA